MVSANSTDGFATPVNHASRAQSEAQSVDSHFTASRTSLPDRAVTQNTIEDAYVDFIYYCNPALPLDSADTESLREAFRNPPRSGGKVFDPFFIYQLVRRFYDKEIKTWTELTIKLGVEPPDPSKDESAQKIAQYGVRLKKWMHSMHVKAFFEYLMGITNDYWTNIPSDPNPIGQPVRDGVAVEDDMALRALLPHIRPKRGRKRPEIDDLSNPAAQRQRLSPGSAIDDARQHQWQNTPVDPRSTMPLDSVQTPASAWPPHDTVQTPLTRWPASAVTPSTRSNFWDDTMEPGSAVTPSKTKAGNLRRGAKNVSSAWKPGGQESRSKTRGRPPINRTPIDTPSTAHAAWPPGNSNVVDGNDRSQPSSASPAAMSVQQSNGATPQNMAGDESHATNSTGQPTTSQHPQQQPTPHTTFQPHRAPQQQESQRPARPSISLQVPQRTGGSVRLATPPLPPAPQQPAHQQYKEPHALPTYDNMHAAPPAGKPQLAGSNGAKPDSWQSFTNAAPQSSQQGGPAAGSPGGDSIPEYFFEKMEDRTNIDALMAYFIRLTHESDWYDADDNPVEPASMEEATAIINSTLENMYRTASSSQAFLINLAALAGARMLMTNLTRCVRVGEQDEHTVYRCEWGYRFGHLHGYFNMAATVPFSMWRAPRPRPKDEEANAGGSGPGKGAAGGRDTPAAAAGSEANGTPQLPPDHWQNKYKTLLGEMEKMDMELFRLRNKVMDSLKTEPREREQ